MQLNRLREALEEQGLELAGLDVDLARDQNSGSSEQTEDGSGNPFGPSTALGTGQTEAPTATRVMGPPSDGEVDYVA